MGRHRPTRAIYSFVLATLLLAGCTLASSESPPPTECQTGSPAEARMTAADQSATITGPSSPLPQTPTPTVRPTAEPTSTPDTRPLPENWREWPIIPTLSDKMVETYLLGIEMGNNPNHFSKAGDCQNIPEIYLGTYDTPGHHGLSEDEAYLEETIRHFAGSFARYSAAVMGGLNFPGLFSPLRADPQLCQAWENPLECELRLWQPSFLIISMELQYSGRTAENFEGYLRQAVEIALSRGIVPILITKADNVEGDHSINQATARVAYAYDLPMINFWLAVQPLPDHGIDWSDTLNPGFHTTLAARKLRSHITLQTLDAAWRMVEPLLPAD
jgi:hypothetical protein